MTETVRRPPSQLERALARTFHSRATQPDRRALLRRYRQWTRLGLAKDADRQRLLKAVVADAASGLGVREMVGIWIRDPKMTPAFAERILAALDGVGLGALRGRFLECPAISVDRVFEVLCEYPAQSAVSAVTHRHDAMADPRVRARLVAMHSTSVHVLRRLGETATDPVERGILLTALAQRNPQRALKLLNTVPPAAGGAATEAITVAADTLTDLVMAARGDDHDRMLAVLPTITVAAEPLPGLPAIDRSARRALRKERPSGRRGRAPTRR